MEQQIGFCTTSDGVTIAYATLGSGPPMVYANGMPGHLALEWEKPFAHEFLQALAQGFTLVRYDMRGSGLSDRDVTDFSVDALVKDLQAVVDHLELERFALLSLGMLAGPIAMTYAAAHPERVTHLILSSAYLRGDKITTPKRQQAILDFVSAFGMVVSIEDFELGAVDARKGQDAREIHRRSVAPEVGASILRTMFSADVSGLVGHLSMPILLLHGRDDRVIPFALGRDLASRLPGAKFVPFEGSGAAPWVQTNVIVPELHRFLGVEIEAPGRQHRAPSGLVTILFTDMEGSTTLTQRLGDAGAQELLRAHDAVVRDALRAHGGSEIKHTGDGIMATFPSASRALECAVAIQRALEGQNRGVGAALAPPQGAASSAPTGPLQVRIGLNAGEPVAEGDDLFGTAVQTAARVCAHAEPGQILASNVVRELAAGKGFLFSDRGDVVLRGFEDPARLYEVRWREEAD